MNNSYPSNFIEKYIALRYKKINPQSIIISKILTTKNNVKNLLYFLVLKAHTRDCHLALKVIRHCT